mgnify:CR=1 FL=1
MFRGLILTTENKRSGENFKVCSSRIFGHVFLGVQYFTLLIKLPQATENKISIQNMCRAAAEFNEETKIILFSLTNKNVKKNPH